MKRVLLAITLLVWACGVPARDRDSVCGSGHMAARDLARIQATAKLQIETPLDLKSQYVCRSRGRDSFVASFDTLLIPQPDGSRRWRSLTCSSNFRRRKPWTCNAWGDFRAVEVGPSKRTPALRVDIPLDMDAGLARRYTSLAFSLLEQGGETRDCPLDFTDPKTPVLRSAPKIDAAALRPLAALRDDLLASERKVGLVLEANGFSLSNYPLEVHFELPLGNDGAPQVRCWSEMDIVVTS